MDPITVPAVVGGCSHLALHCANLTADFDRLRDRFRHVDRDIQLVVTRVNALNAASSQLALWLQQNATPRTAQMLPEVSDVLQCCADLVARIGRHLDKVKPAAKSKAGAGIEQVLREDSLRDYQHMLQGQLQALGMLMQCLQISSPPAWKQSMHLAEKNTTLIQGRFEFDPQQAPAAPPTIRPPSPPPTQRNDSLVDLFDPSQLHVNELSIKPPPHQGEAQAFFENMPPPSEGLKVGSERRYYTTTPTVVKSDPFAGTEEDEPARQKASGAFGLKFLGKMSRNSVIQFEKLTMPQVLVGWPEWHREQRNKALRSRADLAGVLHSGMYTAIRFNHLEYITELLDNGAADTARHGGSWSWLHQAVSLSHDQIVKLLLSRRVCPDVVVQGHGTPLHYAAQYGNETATQTLLEHSANPNVLDAKSRQPLYFALRYLFAIEHSNKQNDPAWLSGKTETTRSAIRHHLRGGVRSVLLLLHHGARLSSDADTRRWQSTLESELSRRQSSCSNLPELISSLADPLEPSIIETAVQVYQMVQHALRDSLREAAKGSGAKAAAVDQTQGANSRAAVKSVRFAESAASKTTAAGGVRRGKKQVKKTEDAQRLDQLLGLT